jgi:hypothetical protein
MSEGQPVTGKEGHHDSHINHHRGGGYTVNALASITVTAVFVADLHVEGERMLRARAPAVATPHRLRHHAGAL